MSHVATVDLDVKDLDALDAACRRLGLELVREAIPYRTIAAAARRMLKLRAKPKGDDQ